MWKSGAMPTDRRTCTGRDSGLYLRRRDLLSGRLGLKTPNRPDQNRQAARTLGIQMKKIILATLLAGIGSTATLAADLGARAPYAKGPAMMAPVASWAGFY